jgi:hypothetical protein
VLLGQPTKSVSGTENVTDSDVDVSNGSISTELNTGEKIFEASFGVKQTYELYNYTADPSETQYQTYNATTRTMKIRGFALNAIFDNCTAFSRRLPLVVKWIDQDLYNTAGTKILNMTEANYFYVISYPTYSGFKIVHDPTYTVYFAVTPTSVPEIGTYGLIIWVLVATMTLAVVGSVLRKKPQP